MPLTKQTCRAALWLLCLISLQLLCWSCAVGPDTSSSYDRTANFATFQTYAWYKAELPPRIAGSGAAYSTLLDQQVKLATESELVKNGLRPSEESPDLLVAYDIALPATAAGEADTVFASGFGYGYSYWYGYRYRYDVTGISTYRNIAELTPGTLVIDLIDPNTNRLIWRGLYEAGIDPVVAGEQEISRAVASVMSQYPPVPLAGQ